MYTYYKLTSLDYNGTIIRVNNNNHHEDYFDMREKLWKPIGIMIHYLWPESDSFEMYEELSEGKAMEVIK